MDDDLRTIESARVEGDEGVHACDLCFCSLDGPEAAYTVVELRAVCPTCADRFDEELLDLPTAQVVNRTIGLVPRGIYAGGRRDPGLNDLGGR